MYIYIYMYLNLPKCRNFWTFGISELLGRLVHLKGEMVRFTTNLYEVCPFSSRHPLWCNVLFVSSTTHKFSIHMSSNQLYSFFSACVHAPSSNTGHRRSDQKREGQKRTSVTTRLVVVSLAVSTTCCRSIRFWNSSCLKQTKTQRTWFFFWSPLRQIG